MSDLTRYAFYDEEPASDTFTLLPEGDYTTQIIQSEIVTTKSGNEAWKIVEQIIEGPKSGRTLSKWINISHPSQQVRQIARGELRKLSIACGLNGDAAECTEVIGIPHITVVKHKVNRANPAGEKQVEMSAWKHISSLTRRSSVALEDDVVPF